MKLTCAQMDVLISFYIDNDLSNALRKQVEEHLRECSTCRNKYDIINSMITDIKSCYVKEGKKTEIYEEVKPSYQYQLFKNNLSSYIDNELSNEESLKIKKIMINNKKARNDLEEHFNIRKLLKDSFKKSEVSAKKDFAKHIIKQLELEEEAISGIHPLLKILVLFTITVLLTSILVLLNII